VTIAVGAAQKVAVTADDNLIRRVTTRVLGDRLVVGTTGSFATKSPMRVEVTVPSLRSLTLSGSGILVAEGVDAKSLDVSLPGSGVLRASGTAGKLRVSLGGSGDAQLAGLAAKDVTAVLGGSGRILVQALDSLDASVSGSGVVMYSGNPQHVTSTVTGSGAIIRG
jgi:hypothetical protein